jgi:hypothetical protein
MASTGAPDKPAQHFVVAGCGYTGERVARLLAAIGPTVGITQSGRAFEFPSLRWDFDAGEPAGLPLSGCPALFRVLYLVPPPPQGTSDPRIRQFLGALSPVPERIVYVSTTGVYGDAGGATVTEDAPPAPATDRARRRLDAETTLRALCESRGVDWVILRVPGIYGPGRLPINRLRRDGPGNRIHVDDLADVCVAALLRPQAANRIYNVGDGDHTTSTAFHALVAHLAGLPLPRQLPRAEFRAQQSDEALAFLGESRRVDTTRLRGELGFRPRHANLEKGVRASLAADRSA